MNSQLARNQLTLITGKVAEALGANIASARITENLFKRPELSEIAPNYIDIRVSNMENNSLRSSNYNDLLSGVDNSPMDHYSDGCGNDCEPRLLQRVQSWEIHYWAINCSNCANPINQVLAMAMDGLMRVYSSEYLSNIDFEVLREDAPETYDESDTPSARLVQHWQASWIDNPLKPKQHG